MTRVVWIDGASGASGDMILGALVDLGLPLDWLRAELARLPLGGYRLEATKVVRSSLVATRVEVILEEDPHEHHHEHPHTDGQDHGHDHDHPHEPSPPHGQGHDHPHEHRHAHDRAGSHGHDRAHDEVGHGPGRAHAHRGLRDILRLLEASTLDREVKELSAALFRRLAQVEAAAHGIPVAEVHFHEVGAVDSIVDTVGGVLGLRWLGAQRIVSSPLNVGSGTVKTAHGVLPVPAPATAELVRGVPVYGDGAGELLTPTGALLITGHAQEWGAMPAMRIERIGCGAGSRDTAGRPNVLRIVVGEAVEAVQTAPSGDSVLVLECEIDDLAPQLLGPLIDRLLGAGALDAYLTPVQMKKGRPGVLVTALVPPAGREAIEMVLFRETTTLGVRYQEWNRTALARESVTVATEYGPVRVKLGLHKGEVTNAQPEFDDCQHAAAAAGVAVKEAWAAAIAAYRRSGERR